ncbi:MAG: flavodoxin family protein [Bacteroidetes bacterium]|nr:flavodoxin family protein [Bacteroidota bacterium]
MKTIVLNGSPKKSGTIASLLTFVTEGMGSNDQTEWVNVYELSMKPCIGCMKCRETDTCVLPSDDAQVVGQKIKEADNLIIGTPTYWGNMSAQLKMLFERNVPVFMGETGRGLPSPRQKGKSAVIVTACTTPYPFNYIFRESRGAVQSVKEILKYGGYKIKGIIVKPGTKNNKTVSAKLIRKANKIGSKCCSK